MTVSLQVESRTARGKQLATVRKAGKLPAIVYGPKEVPQAISVDARTFNKLFKEAGESTVITLQGLGDAMEVLVHDVAFDAARGGIIHVDFYAIEKGKEVTVDVPLEFIGEAPAVKLGGTLTKVLHEVEVTCRPSVLPKHVTVDISSLVDFEQQIHVKDLVLPEGVKIGNEPEEVVVLVQVVKEETEEAPTTIDMSAIAVEEKGKKETEEGAA